MRSDVVSGRLRLTGGSRFGSIRLFMANNRKAVLLVGTATLAIISVLLFRTYVKPVRSVAISTPSPSTPSVPFQSHPSDILQNAVLTRALGIESPSAIEPQLDGMPNGFFARNQNTLPQRLTIWSFFFKGTLTKLGRLNSPSPLIVYYNPIVDVAVVEACRYEGSVVNCTEACALPGESMDNFEASRVPVWLEQDRPLDAFERNAGTRMAVFERDQPADAGQANPWRAKYCSEHLQSEAEVRLIDAYAQFSRLDKSALAGAISRYVVKHGRPIGRRQVSKTPVKSIDATFAMLTHLDQFSVSGFFSPSDGTCLLFLTPKKTGWYQAVLLIEKSSTDALEIRSARIVRFSTQAGG
jgi:hypothetical protein